MDKVKKLASPHGDANPSSEPVSTGSDVPLSHDNQVPTSHMGTNTSEENGNIPAIESKTFALGSPSNDNFHSHSTSSPNISENQPRDEDRENSSRSDRIPVPINELGKLNIATGKGCVPYAHGAPHGDESYSHSSSSAENQTGNENTGGSSDSQADRLVEQFDLEAVAGKSSKGINKTLMEVTGIKINLTPNCSRGHACLEILSEWNNNNQKKMSELIALLTSIELNLDKKKDNTKDKDNLKKLKDLFKPDR